MSGERSPKQAHFCTEEDEELRLPVTYQHREQDTTDGSSQLDLARKTDHVAALDTSNNKPTITPGLGVPDHVKSTRSRSLPTSQLDAVKSEDDQSSNSPQNIHQGPPIPYADIFLTQHQYRNEARHIKCQRPHLVASQQTDSLIGQDSMSVFTAHWTTVDMPRTSTQTETTL